MESIFVPMLIPDMATGQVSIDLCAKRTKWCTSYSMCNRYKFNREAFKIVQRGDADAMITGGTEAPSIWQLLVSVQVERFLQMMTLKQHVVHSKKVETVCYG